MIRFSRLKFSVNANGGEQSDLSACSFQLIFSWIPAGRIFIFSVIDVLNIQICDERPSVELPASVEPQVERVKIGQALRIEKIWVEVCQAKTECSISLCADRRERSPRRIPELDAKFPFFIEPIATA